MDKYEKILKLIKAVNDKYPEWQGMLNLVLFDDGSGHFECKSNFNFESIDDLEEFGTAAGRTLNDVFEEFGIE